MKMKLIIFINIMISFLIIAGCCTHESITPKGNIKELNTYLNESAPVQKPTTNDCSLCNKSSVQTPFDGIKPSYKFFEEILGNAYNQKELFDFMTNYNSGIYYITENSGYFSFAHPDPKFAGTSGLELKGKAIGGVDIYEFNKNAVGYSITNLEDKINSEFWDSHPTVVTDEKCNHLLIWSSDRKATTGGFSYPYKNADLYYCFKINGEWKEVKNFSSIGDYNINTEFNEFSPFVHCNCIRPYLFFSSNRSGNYNIYYVKLAVDFENQTLTVLDNPTLISEEGKDTINTKDNEMFPFLPHPIGENQKIYLSSDRYSKDSVKVGDCSYIASKGGYDIYSYNLPKVIDCTPPKVYYNVKVMDFNEPNRPVEMPIVKVIDFDDPSNPVTKYEANPVFELKAGKCYKTFGGSLYDTIKCTNDDKVIKNYDIRTISVAKPDTIVRDTVIEYFELVEKSKAIKYDTTLITKVISSEELVKIKPTKIQSITKKGNEFEVVLYDIIETKEFATVDTIFKKRKLKIEDVIPRWDTTYQKLDANNLTLSELTKRVDCIRVDKIKQDLYIYDTIYVFPRYYHFPPCEWRYVTLEDFRKNVPYFQTGFWEVNTKDNLSNHLSLLKSEKYDDASFIELSPKNSYFGYKRGDLDKENEAARKRKYQNRVYEYRKFSRVVSENLENMSYEIADGILPLFSELEKKVTNNQEKLFISIHGYSDIRPIEKGIYLGDATISYISAYYDSTNNKITQINKVSIPSNTSMVGENNDILSKLRAYFGYKELLAKLMEYDLFMDYINRGEVLLPDKLQSESDFRQQFEKSKIIFLVQGQMVDPTVMFNIAGYVGKPGDYKILDQVRRINVIVKRMQALGIEIIKKPECCVPPGSPIYKQQPSVNYVEPELEQEDTDTE